MALVGFHTPAIGQTMTWPQQLTDPAGTVDIYQPQFESFKGNTVTGRAAVGLTATGKTAPVFGAFWFTAVADVDQAADQVTLRDIKVTNVRWPNMTRRSRGHVQEGRRGGGAGRRPPPVVRELLGKPRDGRA